MGLFVAVENLGADGGVSAAAEEGLAIVSTRGVAVVINLVLGAVAASRVGRRPTGGLAAVIDVIGVFGVWATNAVGSERRGGASVKA